MSNGELKFLPFKIEEILSGYRKFRNTLGGTKTNVFHCEKENYPSYYLKIANIEDNIDLGQESLVLNWLKDKLPIPEVIHYSTENDKEYLLLSEIQGKPSHLLNQENQMKRIVTLLAKGLRMIHSIDIGECSFDNSLINQITYVRNRINKGLINDQEFDSIRKGRTVKSLYQELLSTKPQSEDLVFTHGDYCLPNILINDNDIIGFIDLGLAGISDRHCDIGIFVRSLSFNFGEKWIPHFLKEYGLDMIDNEKIAFYQLLDEFY